MLAQRVEDGAIRIRSRGRRQHTLGKDNGAKPDGLARPHRSLLHIERGFGTPLKMVGESGADILLRDRSGRRDSRILCLSLQVGHDKEMDVARLTGALHFAGAPVLGVVLIGASAHDETLGIPLNFKSADSAAPPIR